MPDSPVGRIQGPSRLSLSRLKKNRVIKAAIYITMVAAILWLLYLSNTKYSEKGTKPPSARISSSGKGTNASQVDLNETELVEGFGNLEPPDKPTTHSPGEGGKPCKLLPDQEQDGISSQAKYGMNMVCSDMIPLNRAIPDLREKECSHWNYPKNLPNTSVIIVFYNEGFSAVMRTVHSVINRTPPHLLREVLLVDDFSQNEDLKAKLESYIQIWNGTVRVLRNQKREGLINTRSRGAHEARGEVIVFLDAHCEVGINWLPPLLSPIRNNRTTMTVPIIDGIESSTFEVKRVYQEGHHFRGIFEWGMLYKEIELPPKEVIARVHQSEPYKSPTHAGGLFAINREYFLELGAYDPGLIIWGGENFELSFKIWQCGGSILWVPCSRVAHVYKNSRSYSSGSRKRQTNGRLTVMTNYKRVVETWMDGKYKEYFYTREPIARFLDMGDISEQLKLKEKLHCKSFQWFMENVAYDLTSQFPELPPNIHWGEMENIATQSCIDTLGRDAPAMLRVSSCSPIFDRNQLVRLNTQGQLGIGERCVFADSTEVKLEYCKLGTVSGPWRYSEKTNVLYHELTKKCLAADPHKSQLSLMHCDPLNTYQQWKFYEVRP